MNTIALLWIAAGALALMVSLLTIVGVARSLDGSKKESGRQFAQKMASLAERASRHADSRTGGASSQLARTFVSMAAAATDKAKAEIAGDSKPGDKMKNTLTGFAVAGGVIMLVVGILAGDG